MAVPTYSTDLTDIDLAETVTGYVAYGGGGAGLGAGADFSMQGSNCVDKQVTAAEKGILFDNGVGITMTAGDHTFIWQYTATAGVTDTLVNRGVVVNIGSGSGAFVKYHVEGSDTFGAGGRVAKCYAVDQTLQTANTGSIPYRTLVGSPSGTLQFFGSGLKTIATVRSSNMGLDATRYGTGIYITAGEIANPITIDGASIQNDAVANRWGIMTNLGGSYELQGRFAIGQDSAKVATLAYFDDSDVTVVLADTVHSATDFTQIIVDHASTTCNMTNITMTALGTNNKGQFNVTANNPTVNVTGGTWTGLNTTTLQSNSTINSLTWRACGLVTSNSASINSVIFDKPSSTGVLVANLTEISSCTFNSSGTGHAVELNSLGAGTMNWNNSDSGYAGVDGVTGNETIYVNVASGTLTINVNAGSSTPTIRTAGATVTVVSGQVTTTITVKDISTGLVLQDARVYLEADTGGPLTAGTVIINTLTDVNGEVTDTRSLATNQPVIGRVRKSSVSPYFKTSQISATIDNGSGLNLTIQLIKDE